MNIRITLIAAGVGLVLAKALPASIPDKQVEFLSNYCIDCHDADLKKGGINLDLESVDWEDKQSRDIWDRVLHVSDQGLMPPANKKQPSVDEWQTLREWVAPMLLKHTPIGGTLPRRLNKSEYQATIRQLFGMPEFELPIGFPGDTELHGFNNIGAGLVLSPTHFKAYAKVASTVADELFPPEKGKPKIQKWVAGPKDMVLSFSAASVHRDALRLASRSVDIMRSCSWPSRIEIGESGSYRISVNASKFLSENGGPFAEAMILEVYARAVSATDRSKIQDFRLLREIKVTGENSQATAFMADIYEGETILFRWKNAEMTHDPPAVSEAFVALAKANPRFLAAWLKVVFPEGDPKKPIRIAVLRGRNGWDKVYKNMKDPDLDLTHASTDSVMAKAFFKLVTQKGKASVADSLCYYYFENGPALEIHSVTVEGPFMIVDGPKDILRAELREQFAGLRKVTDSDETYARQMLERSLPKVFRRPVDDQIVDRFLSIAVEHWSAGHSFDEGLHLLIRSMLISPRFLYRSFGEGKMDDHDLATRLSYFLTGGPPDAILVDLARRKRLSPAWVLERESKRLMPKNATDVFIREFTGQWLDTALLPEIMPDPKFNFSSEDVEMARSEIEHFFAAMLRENRPVTDFIDPDFTYTSPLFASDVYELKQNSKSKTLRRIPLERGGRVGGLLGQSAIMMATANGVDTQPVLRGVWVLENILGFTPLPPPKDVPALTADTRGTKTPRQILSAHTKNASCATCHKRIDPIGFILENYDPVGRWRTEWPKGNVSIDASGVLPDGTKIRDVVEFKRWLTENVDLFSRCLAEKLMVYATGRELNYAECHEIKLIVDANKKNGNGFRDLLLALITSKTFGTK